MGWVDSSEDKRLPNKFACDLVEGALAIPSELATGFRRANLALVLPLPVHVALPGN